MSVDKLLNYIDLNLKSNISLVDLAMLFHYSTRQIYYIIKETTGMPVMSYIRHQRLLSAAAEISQGRKLFDVAVDYGFETQAGFYKAFLLQIGCSPKDYQYHEQLHNTHRNHPSINKIIMKGNIMEDIIIRKVEQSDVKSIWENIFSRNTPEEVKLRITDSIKEMEVGRRIHLVAVIEGNVIGNIIMLTEQHALYSHRCNIADMVVNPAFQKQGIATKLFNEACKLSSKLGLDYVTTSCRGNGIENFYKSLGMKECGRVPNGIYEPWGEYKTYDEIILFKELKQANY